MHRRGSSSVAVYMAPVGELSAMSALGNASMPELEHCLVGIMNALSMLCDRDRYPLGSAIFIAICWCLQNRGQEVAEGVRMRGAPEFPHLRLLDKPLLAFIPGTSISISFSCSSSSSSSSLSSSFSSFLVILGYLVESTHLHLRHNGQKASLGHLRR